MRKALADSLSESQTLQDLTFWNYPSEIHQIRVEIIIKGKKKKKRIGGQIFGSRR